MDQNEQFGIPADAHKREFTGIWIPVELWDDDQVPALAKLLYGEISSFKDKGCWKKSEELMAPLGISSGKFQQLCRILRERGYISEQRKFGRIVRKTTLGFRSSAQNTHQCENRGVHQAVSCGDEQAVSCGVHIEYTKEYCSKEQGDESIAEPVEKSKKEYGRADLNELVSLWEKEVGVSIAGQQNQRRQLYNLVKKYGLDATKALVRRVGVATRSGDRFAPQIASPSDLTGKYSKLPKLELWENRAKASHAFGSPAPKMATASLTRGVPEYNGAWDEQTDEERAEVSAMMQEFRSKLGAK